MDDSELAQYIRTCPTIKWGAAGFLNKLRFFLPEPAFLTFQRNITLRTLRFAQFDRPLQFVPHLGADSTDILRKKKMPRSNPQFGYELMQRIIPWSRE